MLENLLSMNGFVIANKKLSREIGLNASVMIGMLYSEYSFWEESEKLTQDGYFYCTREKIEYNTGLTPNEQRTAIKKLVDLQILETKLDGMPAKTYYRIDERRLLLILQDVKKVDNKSLKNLTTSSKESSQHVVKNFDINNNINNKNKDYKINKEQNSNFSDSSSLLKSSVIDKPKKKRKTEKEKKLDMLYKKCVEYNVSDTVVELLERFITGLLDDKKRVTEEKVDAILMRLVKVNEQQQIKAIKFSLEKAYYDIDPEWLNNSYNKNNGNPAIRTKSTSTQEGREEYFKAYREGKCKTF